VDALYFPYYLPISEVNKHLRITHNVGVVDYYDKNKSISLHFNA
jgi:hypothetical protein